MAQAEMDHTVTLDESVVSSLAQSDALAKLLIEKGIITQREFMARFSAERGAYQNLLKKIGKGTGAQNDLARHDLL